MTTDTESNQEPNGTNTDPPIHDSFEFDHSVTSRNTRAHWTLYTLDSMEAESEADRDDENGENPRRRSGTDPTDLYEYAAGDDSIVFQSSREVSNVLAELARMGNPFDQSTRPVNRRTAATEWDEADVDYRYRLTPMGRKVLRDLGRPDQLPNRRQDDYDRSLGGVRPAHQPGWWLEEYDLFSDEWDPRDNDWTTTDHERVYFNDVGSGIFANRGYDKIGYKLAEAFEDVTFVLTVGPNRGHDMMYVIRDPWNPVVQIDIYSPMAMHRSTDQITGTFEALARDLRKGLASVREDANTYKSPEDTDESDDE